MAGLDFGFLGGKEKFQTADYRSAGSHQAENLNTILITDDNTWNLITTVTTGKTYYISGIIMGISSTGIIQVQLGTGEAASEIVVFNALCAKDVGNLLSTVQMALPTPLKFASGTKISGRAVGTQETVITLIGWEE